MRPEALINILPTTCRGEGNKKYTFICQIYFLCMKKKCARYFAILYLFIKIETCVLK